MADRTQPSSRRSIGVVIVNYRSAALIKDLLARWERESTGISRIGAVAIVDNDPEGLDPQEVNSNLRIEHLGFLGNRGYASAVNRGWRAIHTEYVLLLGADARMKAADVERMAELLDSHPDVAAIAPLHVDGEGNPINRFHTLPTWLDLAANGTHLYRFEWARRRVRRYRCDWLDGIGPDWPLTPVEQPPAACLLVRRHALPDDPMDERFPIFFNDVDMSKRLQVAGWQTLVAPHITFGHVPAGSSRYLGIRGPAEGYLGAYRYVSKWQGRLIGNVYRTLLLVSLGLAAFLHRPLRRLNVEAMRALVTGRSVFESTVDPDPTRPYWDS